jgi:hypothetical protein
MEKLLDNVFITESELSHVHEILIQFFLIVTSLFVFVRRTKMKVEEIAYKSIRYKESDTS